MLRLLLKKNIASLSICLIFKFFQILLQFSSHFYAKQSKKEQIKIYFVKLNHLYFFYNKNLFSEKKINSIKAVCENL